VNFTKRVEYGERREWGKKERYGTRSRSSMKSAIVKINLIIQIDACKYYSHPIPYLILAFFGKKMFEMSVTTRVCKKSLIAFGRRCRRSLSMIQKQSLNDVTYVFESNSCSACMIHMIY
jgi:hypothetical protein